MQLDPQAMPQVMGILNVTPDSFSDGGRYVDIDAALRQAESMQKEGASIIDIGGESTRPNATVVSLQEELDRVLPVIERCREALDITLSIDTYKAEVMTAAVKAGAGLINDVRALQSPGALAAAAETSVPICLMHMQGSPQTMQSAPTYDNIIEEITDFFSARIQACQEAGIAKNRLILDPGFGFGKTVVHNLQIVSQLQHFQSLGCPLLLGVSRKSTIGAVLEREVDDRLAGSLALSSLAIERGARIIRAHDVKATMDAIKITWEVLAI